MTQPTDIRWQQRFANFRKALARLTEAVELHRQRPLSDLERQGLIQAFESTHELAWKTLKDFAEFLGTTGLMGSRDTTRTAFKMGLIEDGENWMEMIRDRNLSTHTYDEETALGIEQNVIDIYYPLFEHLSKHLQEKLDDR
jgi:nucleotidyltransferase substrate binding protein (TIGR01987 family)